MFGIKPAPSKDAQSDDQDQPKFQVPKDTGKGTPDLASVPSTAPTPPSTKQEREKVIEGLLADRERARYTDQETRAEPIDVRPLSEVAAAPDVVPPPAPAGTAQGVPVQPVTKLQTPPGKTPTADELAAQADIPPPPPPPSDLAGTRLPAAVRSAAVGPASSADANAGIGPGPGPEQRSVAALGVRSDGFRPLESYARSGSTLQNRVASIDFDLNADSLTPPQRRTVSDAAKLAKTGNETFRVIGRSNNASQKAQTLAAAVARELQSSGISQDRIFVGTDSGPEGRVDVILDK